MIQMDDVIEALKAKGYDSRNAHAFAFGAAWSFLTEKQKKVILSVINKKEVN